MSYICFMIRKIANKIMKNLMMYPSDNQIVRKYIEIPLLAMCNNLAFGNNFFKYISNIIYSHKKVSKIILIVVSVFGLFYTLGYISTISKIETLKLSEISITNKLKTSTKILVNEKNEKNKYIKKYSDIVYSTDYMFYIVYKHSKLFIPQNFDTTHLKIMFREADKNEIPYSILFRLIDRECKYIKGLKSNKGASHYMQVMPSTRDMYRKILKLKNVNEIEENIMIGCRLLQDLYTIYSKKHNSEKSWVLALAAYNSGIGTVESYGGVPPFNETLGYIKYILKHYDKNEIATPRS